MSIPNDVIINKILPILWKDFETDCNKETYTNINNFFLTNNKNNMIDREKFCNLLNEYDNWMDNVKLTGSNNVFKKMSDRKYEFHKGTLYTTKYINLFHQILK